MKTKIKNLVKLTFGIIVMTTLFNTQLYAKEKLGDVKIKGGTKLSDGTMGYEKVINKRHNDDNGTTIVDLTCTGQGYNPCVIYKVKLEEMGIPETEFDEIDVNSTNYLIVYATNRIYDNNEPTGSYNYTIVTPDNETRIYSVSWSPIVGDPDGDYLIEVFKY
ncbi:MAG: hypothetical protein KF882_06985 [Bacteroidia bacterium]|nr:hypothetical protein [Bacteroidia bacterium]MCO5254452.1 hypothetical protein [Bacteroidota bacterium]